MPTIDAKVDALLCHRSQWRSTMGIEERRRRRADAQRAAFEARIRDEVAARPAARSFKLIAEL